MAFWKPEQLIVRLTGEKIGRLLGGRSKIYVSRLRIGAEKKITEKLARHDPYGLYRHLFYDE